MRDSRNGVTKRTSKHVAGKIDKLKDEIDGDERQLRSRGQKQRQKVKSNNRKIR